MGLVIFDERPIGSAEAGVPYPRSHEIGIGRDRIQIVHVGVGEIEQRAQFASGSMPMSEATIASTICGLLRLTLRADCSERRIPVTTIALLSEPAAAAGLCGASAFCAGCAGLCCAVAPGFGGAG